MGSGSAVVERAAAALAERRLAPLTVVGELTHGAPGRVRVVDAAGRPIDADRRSWDHFASAERHGPWTGSS